MPDSRAPASKVANLTPEVIAQLAERDDTVVYQPVHTTIFEPWPATRVRRVVKLIVAIAARCASPEEARGKLRGLGADVLEFEGKYQLMFERLTQPETARNKGHVEIVLAMIGLRESVDGGTLSEEDAGRFVAEQALTRLLAQAQAASQST